MIEDQVHQHPVRLPPDKHAHVDVTGVKFENDQSKEPLLFEKQSFHRVTLMDTRMRAITEVSHGNTVTGNNVGVNVATVTTTATDAAAEKLMEEDCVEIPIFEEGTTDSGRLPDLVAESKIYGVSEDEPLESYLAITIQVFIPFLIAGLGMVGAGLVLDLVHHWIVFKKVKELIILVPALLGLKGNLEMTLASRLSTQANLGHMDTPKQQWYMIVGNLVLIQCQAIVVGFLGSVVAIVMGSFRNGTPSLDHAYLLCASSLVTASLASFVLGLITAGVIVFSRHYWLAPLVIACYVLVTPLWVWIAKKNKYTNDVLYSGWTPVMIAMLISSWGGLILEFMVRRFANLTVFQPVINGVGGNLVAVQASRISTALHKQAELGTLLIPPGHTHPVIFVTPIANFFGKGIHARTTRVLMAMVIPGHIIFIYLINYMKDGNTSLTPLFVFVYLCAAMLQVAALLYIAYIMIHWMWKRKIDPDNSAIPYLTAMGDLLGISLLAIAFQFLYLVGDQDSDRTIAP
ncbi:Solute carrier family 41 member 1 [Dufourea novaeangliae]|uniref:Solute carrier family 41 member 1 n=1 Tax=Dufourea novaeangliae TaxID=178035 RepID=A0A154PL89_DUFNO|nr:Solute carrier family 41 member 1 [Dufourea novaeangliae]